MKKTPRRKISKRHQPRRVIRLAYRQNLPPYRPTSLLDWLPFIAVGFITVIAIANRYDLGRKIVGAAFLIGLVVFCVVI